MNDLLYELIMNMIEGFMLVIRARYKHILVDAGSTEIRKLSSCAKLSEL